MLTADHFKENFRDFSATQFIVILRLFEQRTVQCPFMMDMTMDTGAMSMLPKEGMEHINPQFQQVRGLQRPKVLIFFIGYNTMLQLWCPYSAESSCTFSLLLYLP